MIMENEVFKPIDGGYEISNIGRLKNKHGRFLKPYYDGQRVSYILRINGKRCHRNINQLVVQAFGNPRYENCYIKHKDGNPLNNHISNLSYSCGEPTDEQRQTYEKNIYNCIYYLLGDDGIGGIRKDGFDVDNLIQITAFMVWKNLTKFDKNKGSFLAFVYRYYKMAKAQWYAEEKKWQQTIRLSCER